MSQGVGSQKSCNFVPEKMQQFLKKDATIPLGRPRHTGPSSYAQKLTRTSNLARDNDGDEMSVKRPLTHSGHESKKLPIGGAFLKVTSPHAAADGL